MKPSLGLIDQVNSTCEVGYSKTQFNVYLNRLNHIIDSQKCKDPYLGLRIAEVRFKEPYLLCTDIEVIALAIMRLLMKYVYSTVFEYGKFTIGYVMKIPTGEGEVTYTIGDAISLVDKSGDAIPNSGLCAIIIKYLIQKAEDYDESRLSGIYIRVYLAGMREKELAPCTDEEIDRQIFSLMQSVIGAGEPPEAKVMKRGKRRYPDHVTALKPTSKDFFSL